ncbi:PREDICTED: von Willebrand factor A domain-containing protein 5A [Chinchilla lanigera]|uniref:von Willebrand factor A domain-containing protein 5A n=1 Tax=Chinchilla lanigera TaxID=34839 RepID=A0A8C2VZU3_CHILA|nr:PREDICTED: von Willebrand factor A domain-containing protein 5A [Chinchilla lanigera]XP_005378466.1 PREDICTED: von Willebrand factor A domain-containing protein 5A [Chinchilla lanigera]
MVSPGGLLTRQNQPVALKNISVTVSIREFVAGVSATLHYENEENVALEAFFVFPMDEDSAVYTFEALVDGNKIVAELQDKMKAHADYEDAISQGYQAYLLEEDKCSRDVFCCNVGNLQPGAKVALTLRYVQELPLEADGALRYVLPAILNPRYQPSGQTEDNCVNLKTPIMPLEDLPYTLNMVTSISSQHGIDRVQSNCPLSPMEYLEDDKTSAQVALAEGHKFDQDVELLIYYSAVHSPRVAVETGMPEKKPDSLMGDPAVMLSFYPDIPEVEASMACGEFVFLMDRSGSMQTPLSKQDRSQLRIEAAKETLILLLKSLPLDCYFNIYGFGSSFEAFFPESVKYTQQTMEEAVERVKVLRADLGGTEILTPLQKIFRGSSIPGHPLQLFVFTDGEVTNTFSVIKEVKFNSTKHRCFSFGIGEGASTSLIKSIARVSGGTSEFITGKDRMQSKVLRTLKWSLQSVVEDISLSWDLPPDLTANMLSPEQTVIFRGQRLIFYAQLTGTIPTEEATGAVCLKYTLQGKNIEQKVTFSLQPKCDSNFTIHRLAAKSLIQTKDLGFRETPARERQDILNISTESGVMSSFTAFIAINKELNRPVQGPLFHREIPRPVLYARAKRIGHYHSSLGRSSGSNEQSPLPQSTREVLCCGTLSDWKNSELPARVVSQSFSLGKKIICALPLVSIPQKEDTHSSTNETSLQNNYKENGIVQLISLQNANGSWDLNKHLASVLGMKLEDVKAAHPAEPVNSSVWATVLAVVWLHTNAMDRECEWDLLERKARAWIRTHAGSATYKIVKAANEFLKSFVDPAIFTF